MVSGFVPILQLWDMRLRSFRTWPQHVWDWVLGDLNTCSWPGLWMWALAQLSGAVPGRGQGLQGEACLPALDSLRAGRFASVL